jgi:rhodanese-related sulfurtransferase
VNPLHSVPQIDAVTTHDKSQHGEVSLLDVREKSEWDLGHIEGSEFIPLWELQWRWSELDKEKSWVCVCRMGSRSLYAAALLRQAGYDAASMEGGMLDWQAHNLPITDPGIVAPH